MPSQQALRPGGESLLPEERLRKRADFQRCYKRGRRHHGSLVTLHLLERDSGPVRLGITVTRKVGGAVVRQRTKRRIREIFRRWHGRYRSPAFDVVIHARPNAGSASFAALESEVLGLLRSLPHRHERTP